ncbi:MAG: protein kinase [Nitrospira sp.]|nr:protein kinase [Nitrospira sp.]
MLGKGAMGEVLEVRDQFSGTDYAVKRVPEAVSGSAAEMERIRLNFNLVSPLTHPHICQTRNLEIDAQTGAAYLILDLVRGETLSHWAIKRRAELGHPNHPLAAEVVIGIAEQVASALDYAHSQPLTGTGAKRYGIIHRDLKPDNLMLENGRESRPGVVKGG